MVEKTSKVEALLKLAKKGPIRARDLKDRKIPRAYLQRFCERGLLEQVDRGLYRLVDAPMTEQYSLAEVTKRVPRGTICLFSALQMHELTTEMPHEVWVLIDRHARVPKLNYPKLRIVRASGKALEHGVEQRIIAGVSVKLTTPAKTVADCFRYRRHVGRDVALDALRDYLAKSRGSTTTRERELFDQGDGVGYGNGAYGSATLRGDGHGDPHVYSIDALVEAARVNRIYSVMRPYMEALV